MIRSVICSFSSCSETAYQACQNLERPPSLCYPEADRGVAQLGSAPAWGAGGRWFESSLPDQSKTLRNSGSSKLSRSSERSQTNNRVSHSRLKALRFPMLESMIRTPSGRQIQIIQPCAFPSTIEIGHDVLMPHLAHNEESSWV